MGCCNSKQQDKINHQNPIQVQSLSSNPNTLPGSAVVEIESEAEEKEPNLYKKFTQDLDENTLLALETQWSEYGQDNTQQIKTQNAEKKHAENLDENEGTDSEEP